MNEQVGALGYLLKDANTKTGGSNSHPCGSELSTLTGRRWNLYYLWSLCYCRSKSNISSNIQVVLKIMSTYLHCTYKHVAKLWFTKCCYSPTPVWLATQVWTAKWKGVTQCFRTQREGCIQNARFPTLWPPYSLRRRKLALAGGWSRRRWRRRRRRRRRSRRVETGTAEQPLLN